MDIFKKASRLGLRVATTKGLLTVEQLWTVPLNVLSNAIKEVKQEIKSQSADTDEDLAFLDNRATKVDPILNLKFAILKEVYLELKAEKEEEDTARETKANNQKILALIAQKEEAELGGKSIEELRALLK